MVSRTDAWHDDAAHHSGGEVTRRHGVKMTAGRFSPTRGHSHVRKRWRQTYPFMRTSVRIHG
jgi:hypothetical protein